MSKVDTFLEELRAALEADEAREREAEGREYADGGKAAKNEKQSTNNE